MSGNSANQGMFTTGGTVQAGNGIYLSRRADEELLALCRSGAIAYVLTPRQMGKSSLMVETARRLVDEGVRSVVVDLTQIGVVVNAEEWYLGILTLVEEQLLLDTDVMEWWRSQAHLGVTQRLTRFFQQVVLTEVDEPIVVFIDEIDTTLRLDFTDDFFAAIRFLYTERSRMPELGRLSFVLIGVATPGDLIRDVKRTPFNVGTRVDLTDFTLAEAMPLAVGLGVPEAERQAVLGWVLEWTGGHPYLTQRLCEAIVQAGDVPWDEAAVRAIVQQTFLGEQSDRDNNLQFVRNMLTKRAPEEGQDAVLRAYREVWRGRHVADEEHSLIQLHLKLSGVVKKVGQWLQLRNQIYQRVFDGKWIRENLSESWLTRYWPVLRVTVPVTVASLLSAGMLLAFAQESERQRLLAIRSKGEALEREQKAQQNAEAAQENAQKAQASEQEALKQKSIAEQQKKIAVANADKTNQALLREQTTKESLKQALTEANQQRKAIAVDNHRIAQQQQLAAEAKQTQIAEAQMSNSLGRRSSLFNIGREARLASENSSELSKLQSWQRSLPLTSRYSAFAAEFSLDGSSSVNAVAFSLDGRRIVSGSGDNTVQSL